MTPERPSQPIRPPHCHWSEDELFERALGLDSAADGADCAACRARLEAVAAGLAKLRSAAVEGRARESVLAERILAATVREGSDWRGDFALVSSFVRERLRSSAWLRLAAALLFIHAAALPVLAWIVLRSERAAPHFFSSLEPLPRESAFAESALESPPPLEEGEPAEPRLVELGVEDAAARARWSDERGRQASVLRAFDWPAARESEQPSEAFALRLWMRSRQATHGAAAPAAWAAERASRADAELTPQSLDLLALELEIELDRVARGAHERAARELCERWASQLRSGDSELARWALARAARMGVLRGEGGALEGERWSTGESGAKGGVLFDAQWFEALRRAASSSAAQAGALRSAAEEALVQAWLVRGELK